MPCRFDIEVLSPAAAEDPALVSALTDLINEVYAAAEDGLWTEGTTRTSAAEVAGITRAGEFAVAVGPGQFNTVAAHDGQLLGCVRIRRLDGDVSEFGMLAVAPSHHGTGIGRELVRYAERISRDAGSRAMQLELLVPRTWQHSSKEFLARWYERIGYQVIRTGTTDEFYPELTPLLATPCDFVVYRKDIGLRERLEDRS
ncbi:MAG: GNAT family N-acetyltransferase [Streptosporangiaceae bacterium]|nr:GNAT family N-acetyltransferase [Streptosporangiaceae bacterium]